MRKLVFDRCGDPEDVLYLTDCDDVHPQPDEVKLRITLRPVNPADIAFVRGLYVPPESYPACPGMEGVGVVEALGSNVKGIKEGSRCVVTRVRGTWAEYMTVPTDNITPVPGDIPDEQACQMFINPVTAYLLLHGVKRPGAVVQTAAGSAVGRLVNQFAKISNRKVINIVRNRLTADDLKAQGVQHVVISEDEDWFDQVRIAAGDEPIVAAFDPVSGQTGQEILSALSTDGVLFLYGGLSGKPVAVNAMQLAVKNLSVRGFWLAPWFTNTATREKQELFREIISLFQENKLNIPVAAVYKLEDFKEAIRQEQKPGRLGKVLLEG